MAMSQVERENFATLLGKLFTALKKDQEYSEWCQQIQERVRNGNPIEEGSPAVLSQEEVDIILDWIPVSGEKSIGVYMRVSEGLDNLNSTPPKPYTRDTAWEPRFGSDKK